MSLWRGRDTGVVVDVDSCYESKLRSPAEADEVRLRRMTPGPGICAVGFLVLLSERRGVACIGSERLQT